MTLLGLENAYCRSKMIRDVHFLVQNCLQFVFIECNKVMKHWTVRFNHIDQQISLTELIASIHFDFSTPPDPYRCK